MQSHEFINLHHSGDAMTSNFWGGLEFIDPFHKMRIMSTMILVFLLVSEVTHSSAASIPCSTPNLKHYQCFTTEIGNERCASHWKNIENNTSVDLLIQCDQKFKWLALKYVAEKDDPENSEIVLVHSRDGRLVASNIYRGNSRPSSSKKTGVTVMISNVTNISTEIRAKIKVNDPLGVRFLWVSGEENPDIGTLPSLEWKEALLETDDLSLTRRTSTSSTDGLVSVGFDPHAYLKTHGRKDEVSRIVNAAVRSSMSNVINGSSHGSLTLFDTSWSETLTSSVMLLFVFAMGLLVGVYGVLFLNWFRPNDGRSGDAEDPAEVSERDPCLATLQRWILTILGFSVPKKTSLKLPSFGPEPSAATLSKYEGKEPLKWESLLLKEPVLDQKKFTLGKLISEGAFKRSIVGEIISNILQVAVRQKLNSVDHLKVIVEGDSWQLLTGRSKGFHAYLRRLDFQGAITTEAEAFTMPQLPEIHFDLGNKQRGISGSPMLKRVLSSAWVHVRETSLLHENPPDCILPLAFPPFSVRFRGGYILLTEANPVESEGQKRKPIKWALQCTVESQSSGWNELIVKEADGIDDDSYINCTIGRVDRRGLPKWRSVVELPEKVNWRSCSCEKGWFDYSYTIFLDC